MNPTTRHLGLASVVFAPAVDDVPLSIIVSEHSIDAQVCLHGLPDADRIAGWRRVVDSVGEAHGGTPWTLYVMSYAPNVGGNVRATHSFDEVHVSIWTAVDDPEAARAEVTP